MKSNAHAWILSGLVVCKFNDFFIQFFFTLPSCKWVSDGYLISKSKFQFIRYTFDLHNYLWTIQSIDWLSPWIFVIHNTWTTTISVATIDWTLLWNHWMWWWRIIDAMTLTVLTLCWGSNDDVDHDDDDAVRKKMRKVWRIQRERERVSHKYMKKKKFNFELIRLICFATCKANKMNSNSTGAQQNLDDSFRFIQNLKWIKGLRNPFVSTLTWWTTAAATPTRAIASWCGWFTLWHCINWHYRALRITSWWSTTIHCCCTPIAPRHLYSFSRSRAHTFVSLVCFDEWVGELKGAAGNFCIVLKSIHLTLFLCCYFF